VDEFPGLAPRGREGKGGGGGPASTPQSSELLQLWSSKLSRMWHSDMRSTLPYQGHTLASIAVATPPGPPPPTHAG